MEKLENTDKREDNQNSLSELTQTLMLEGVPFNLTLPTGLREGVRYTTPTELSASGVTKYTRQNIVLLLNRGIIPGYQVGSYWLIDAGGVATLLEYEADSLSKTKGRGSQPGRRKNYPNQEQ